jgi:hypothetical protein
MWRKEKELMEEITQDSSQTGQALKKIEREIREGLRHGFFEITLECKVANGKQRDFVVKAGKHHRYLISEEEAKKA